MKSIYLKMYFNVLKIYFKMGDDPTVDRLEKLYKKPSAKPVEKPKAKSAESEKKKKKQQNMN